MDLSPILESALAAEAAHLPMSLEAYALQVLAIGRIKLPPTRTLGELVAYWQREGIIGWGLEGPDSPEYARMLREQNQNRHRM